MIRRIFAGLFGLLLLAGAAAAQNFGNIQSGEVIANSSASTQPARPTTGSAWLDRWCGSTQNFVPIRGASNWSCAQLAASNLSNGTTGLGSVVLATSPTFVTSIVSPLVIGGTGTGSSLSLQSTSGVGATDFIKFLVGNNGATEAARFDNAGTVLVGATASAAVTGGAITPHLQVHGPTGGAASLANFRWSNDAGGANNYYLKSRGASAGSHSAVSSGDNIGLFQMQGSDGSSFSPAADILVQVDAAASSANVPGRIMLRTTASGVAGPTEAIRIDNKQHIGVTAAAAPTVGTCGTSPTVTSGSTDVAGELTTGSTATTACTLTFANAYTNTPNCVVTPQGTTPGAVSAVPSTTTLVLTYTSSTSQKMNWICIGKQTQLFERNFNVAAANSNVVGRAVA